jgi:hypothetical protein
MVEGIRQKLQVKEILRHRLTYRSMDEQQEVTHTRGWDYAKTKKLYTRSRAIVNRGIMLDPDLYLAFSNEPDAHNAFSQHICLARNEDVMLPEEYLGEIDKSTFDKLPGFELLLEKGDDSFLVGYNRFADGAPMYGRLEVTKNPLKQVQQYD